MLSRRRHSGGFSLVEMVTALVIFSVAVVATIEIFMMCLRSTGTSLNHTRAVFLAQGLIEETLGEGTVMAEEESGELDEGFPGAAWTREIVESDTAGLYEVRVTVTWEERDKERTFQLTTLAAER